MSVDTVEAGSTRGRKAVPLSDKIAKALDSELSAANKSFLEWVTGEVSAVDPSFEIDAASFALAATLYQDYTSTEEFQLAAAARKEEREKRAAVKAQADFAKFAELAKRFGKKIVDIEEDEDSDSDIAEDDAE